MDGTQGRGGPTEGVARVQSAAQRLNSYNLSRISHTPAAVKGSTDYDDHADDRVRSRSLVTCGHRDHRGQRRLVQPAFYRNRIPG
jgi:cytochrome P450